MSAPDRIASFEGVYGAQNLQPIDPNVQGTFHGVRVITAAPEIDGVMNSIGDLVARGIIFSVGHRLVFLVT
jgi:N-acetylglucosamine-6-phosphate deacetylase